MKRKSNFMKLILRPTAKKYFYKPFFKQKKLIG